ncbi:MAG: RNA pseudouridine synthase [Candidatus Zapsychrus exili]|nr:RNA pseudouridine synthase [Candidatus Zapsychrus exili]
MNPIKQDFKKSSVSFKNINKKSGSSCQTTSDKEKSGINVLFEDTNYVVFDKPSGLLVIPTEQERLKTLVNIVNQDSRFNANAFNLHPCHRLDKETSGAIIFSKGKRPQQLMMEEFKQGQVLKKYIAFVHGTLEAKKDVIRAKVKSFDKRKFNKSSKEKDAITSYRTLEVRDAFTVVEVAPITGRSNQIRIHFKQIGHPLVGDYKYSFRKDYTLKFKRTALHAASLEFRNPITKNRIKVKSKLPKDMEVFLARNSS